MTAGIVREAGEARKEKRALAKAECNQGRSEGAGKRKEKGYWCYLVLKS